MSPSRSALLCGLLCMAVLDGCARTTPERVPSPQRARTVSVAPEWPELDTPPPRTGGGENDAALVVSIEDYTAPGMPDVPGAHANGLAWYNYLVKTRGVPGTRVRWMRDADAADREELRSAAEAAAGQLQPGGTLWFIFIGHGVPAKDAKEGLLVAADARPTPQSVYSRSLSKADLEKELLKGEQGRRVVLLDTCFSGRDRGGDSLLPGIQPGLPVMPDTRPEVTLMSAGGSDEFAGALPGASRPAFSYLVLGALRGWGDSDGNGEVTAEEAVRYARDVLTVLPTGRRQTPQLQGGTEPLVLARGARERGPQLEAMRAEVSPESRPVDLSMCPDKTADGCVEQGRAYYFGRGVAQDRLKASTLWRAACDAGHSTGCFLLGQQYESGADLKQDPVKAARLYALACKGGLSKACVDAGVLYAWNADVGVPPEQAYAFFQAACEGTGPTPGDARGCTYLGELHARGRGAELDAARAASYYQRGCLAGHAHGCTLLGELYETGSGVARNAEKARALYEDGCKANDGGACEKLGDMLVRREPARALQFYLQGCDVSALGACGKAGVLYSEGRRLIPRNLEQAIRLFEKACSASGTDADSCVILASYYLEGNGVSRNVARAAELLEQACRASTTLSSACVHSGQLFLGATDVPPDKARARELFHRACQMGNAEGCELLKR